MENNFRLCEVVLDHSIGRAGPDIEHERAVAIFDLVDDSSFMPCGHDGGPYRLTLSLTGSKLGFAIAAQDLSEVATHVLSLSPFRRIIQDYFTVCETYYEAIRFSAPSRIESIDMGRRSLHNEGAQLLKDRLKNKIEVDFSTARRLFTLVCVLHRRD